MVTKQLKRFDYTGKDYDQMVSEVIQFLKTEYPERWTDFEHDNAGRMLIDAFAFVCDMLLFYLDRQSNECYLATAKERQKIMNICKLIGYNLSSAVPARAEVVFNLYSPSNSNVTIPQGTALSTIGGIRFELEGEVVIPYGELTGSGVCVEGQTYTQVIGRSTDAAGQAFVLPHKGVIAVMEVKVGTDSWERVDSLALAAAKDKVYSADIDAFGQAKISFGDGKYGAIPLLGTTITAMYRVGGGSSGNVAANTITRMPIVAQDTSGQSVVVSVSNPVAATGGMEAEDVEHARAWAPISFETQGRLVTDKDYEAAANGFSAENIGRFAKAKAIVHERSGEANVIRIYALAQGVDGGLTSPQQTLIDAFIEGIDDIKMLTDFVDVVPARLKYINVIADVCLLQGFTKEDVLDYIHTNLINFFKPEKRDMGQSLRYSDLYRAMDDTVGVDWVEIKEPLRTVSCAVQELIVLGDIELKVVDDNE